MEKIGLVLEGGGVRGAYTAGALAWLSENHITFDYHVGISSGAVYLCCYLTGKTQSAKNMATIYAADPKLVGIYALLHCGYYVDYRKIFKEDLIEKEQLSMKKIKEEHMPMEVGAYDLGKGETVYFGSQDLDENLDLLRGTCALPVASEVVDYNGLRLLDGGITKMIPIERALEQGCTKALIITTKPASFVRKPSSKIVRFMMKHLYKECPQVEKDYAVRHINYYKQRKIIDDMVEKGTAVNIYPSREIKVSRWKGDPERCTELYTLGYQDMEAHKEEILKFLDKGGKGNE